MTGRVRIGIIAAIVVLAAPAWARATMIGATDPSNTDPGVGDYCVATNANYLQAGIAPGDPSYTVPAGGGTVTSWSTRYGVNGQDVGLEVWRPGALEAQYSLVALDSETIARNAQGISRFPVSIAVHAGDVIGIQQPVPDTTDCTFRPNNTVNRFDFAYFGSPTVGQTIVFDEMQTVFGDLVNVSATVRQSADLSVSESATPATVPVGALVQLRLKAADAGPAPSSATIADTLPKGLSAISAVAQDGNCRMGPGVSCQLSVLSPGGGGAQVLINARATTAGSYTNSVRISGLTSNGDPHPANNTAVAHVKVIPNRPCIVPKLIGQKLATAKSLLGGANCALGHVTKPKHPTSALVVVSQHPGAGSPEPPGASVGIKLGPKH
jgi:hypothetical protein